MPSSQVYVVHRCFLPGAQQQPQRFQIPLGKTQAVLSEKKRRGQWNLWAVSGVSALSASQVFPVCGSVGYSSNAPWDSGCSTCARMGARIRPSELMSTVTIQGCHLKLNIDFPVNVFGIPESLHDTWLPVSFHLCRAIAKPWVLFFKSSSWCRRWNQSLSQWKETVHLNMCLVELSVARFG